MIFFIIVLLVALAVASPYLVIVGKRKRMLKGLEGVARRNGFRVRRLHRLVCFSFNRSPIYDLLFECKSHAYAVKLWSAVKKNSTLIICGGKALETVSVPSPMDTGKSEDTKLHGHQRSVWVTKNNFKVKRGKPVAGILLCYPYYKEILAVRGSERKRLTEGDRIFDKMICSPASLVNILEENGERELSVTESVQGEDALTAE